MTRMTNPDEKHAKQRAGFAGVRAVIAGVAAGSGFGHGLQPLDRLYGFVAGHKTRGRKPPGAVLIAGSNGHEAATFLMSLRDAVNSPAFCHVRSSVCSDTCKAAGCLRETARRALPSAAERMAGVGLITPARATAVIQFSAQLPRTSVTTTGSRDRMLKTSVFNRRRSCGEIASSPPRLMRSPDTLGQSPVRCER